MTLNELYKLGIHNVWKFDTEAQNSFLDTICRERGMLSDSLKDLGAFFVPNDAYLAARFGEEIKEPQFDCYSHSGICMWNNNLVLPIFDPVSTVVGFVGYNPFRHLEAKEEQNWSLNYYIYSTKKVFNKSSFLYCPPGDFVKAMEDDYLLVTDGVFDTISLYNNGFHAASLMGSDVTDCTLMQLRAFKRILLVADNDEAGMRLYDKLKRRLKSVELVKQGITKDADELLKGRYTGEFVVQLKNAINTGVGTVHLMAF